MSHQVDNVAGISHCKMKIFLLRSIPVFRVTFLQPALGLSLIWKAHSGQRDKHCICRAASSCQLPITRERHCRKLLSSHPNASGPMELHILQQWECVPLASLGPWSQQLHSLQCPTLSPCPNLPPPLGFSPGASGRADTPWL